MVKIEILEYKYLISSSKFLFHIFWNQLIQAMLKSICKNFCCTIESKILNNSWKFYYNHRFLNAEAPSCGKGWLRDSEVGRRKPVGKGWSQSELEFAPPTEFICVTNNFAFSLGGPIKGRLNR